MSTVVASVESITSYYDGRDDPERIKTALIYAYENLGTRYVLLVGDAANVPVRFRFEQMQSTWRVGVYAPTDLYYANLYRGHEEQANGSVITAGPSWWDLDRDHWYNFENFYVPNNAASANPDGVDGYADLAVGRLPAHSVEEVSRYVARVINYESGARRPRGRRFIFVLDKNYDTSSQLADGTVSGGGLQAPRWDGPDRLGANYASSDPRPLNVRLIGPHGLRRATESGAMIGYIGHGWTGGWDFDESFGDSVQTFDNVTLPVVFCAGCQTGQLTSSVPDGPNGYLDISGQRHWYWTLPAGDHPDRIVDFGANDPAGGSGVPERSFPAVHGQLPTILPEEPSTWDAPDQTALTVARQWLLGSSAGPAPTDGGGIAYFGEQTVAPDYEGAELMGNLLAALPGSDNAILGDLWVAGCRQYWRRHRNDEDMIACARIYLSYMTLYGDPSLRLAFGPSELPPTVSVPPWQADGGVILSTMAFGRNADGRLEIFGVGDDGNLWHRRETSVNGPWSDWVRLGVAPLSAGRPSVTQNSDGRLEVFATGTDGQVHHVWQNSPDDGWSDWASLGGTIASAPTAIQNADGHIEVFAVRTDGHLMHRWQGGIGWWPPDWDDLGRPNDSSGNPVGLMGNLTAARNADGRVEVFARDTNASVCHIWQVAPNGPGWSGWARFDNATATSDLTVVSNLDGRLEVFGVGSDSKLNHVWETADGNWSTWSTFDGADLWEPGDIVAVPSPQSGVSVFATGSDGSIIWARLTLAGQWTPLENLHGDFLGPLAAGVHQDGHLEVIAQGTDQGVYHLSETAPGGPWQT